MRDDFEAKIFMSNPSQNSLVWNHPRHLWMNSPREIFMSPEAVHVWSARLDLPAAIRGGLAAALSADEQSRAARFRFDKHRDRFIAARGILRQILSLYLCIPAAQVRFSLTQYGKPELSEQTGEGALQFNVSHSHDIALYAVTRSRRIGVDIEHVRAIDAESIARWFFSDGEYRSLRAVPEAQKIDTFLTCWTRKEAYIKARGEGLSMPLDSFEVSVLPNAPPKLLWNRTDPEEVERWTVTDVCPDPDYLGALVVEGHGWQLSTWTWQPGREVDR